MICRTNDSLTVLTFIDAKKKGKGKVSVLLSPGEQNSLILLQLFHKGRVWFGDGASLFDVVKGGFQVPAVFFHGVGDDGGGRAAHTHLTVNQTLGTGFSVRDRDRVA